MGPPARWTTMDSPVKPANDEGECGTGLASCLHPTSVTLRLDRRMTVEDVAVAVVRQAHHEPRCVGTIPTPGSS